MGVTWGLGKTWRVRRVGPCFLGGADCAVGETDNSLEVHLTLAIKELCSRWRVSTERHQEELGLLGPPCFLLKPLDLESILQRCLSDCCGFAFSL